ncbi:thioredoxin-like protein [Plasmodium yoelii yoelii]|uniref:Thioredoxin-like protein n=1 Tax=Plasmodium yoelii yoelii TaxID=73239 RepID=A0AAF0B119_PLAYO|nr:thioredoxin-like protein [Plasmodium yoelii yoelii]
MFVHFNYPYRVEKCVNKNINAKVNYKNIIQRNITNKANVDNKISSNRKKNIYMLSILISSILGYGALKWDEKKKISNFLNEMTEISDDVFDKIDNIVLFVLDKNKLNDEKKKVQFLKHEIEKLNIKNLNYLYTFHEESKDFACYIYKGRRRRNITKEELVDTSYIKEIFEQFFIPISEDSEKLNEGNNGIFPTYVTHDTFEKEVIYKNM